MEINAAALWLNTTFAAFDEAVALLVRSLYYAAGGFFTPFFDFISFLGHDGIPLIIIALILMIFKKTRRCGTAMLFGLAAGALITNCVLKVLIARPRPYADPTSIYYQMWQTVGMNTESDKSFPSGHTTAAFAAMVAVFMTTPKKYSWTGFIFAVLMGISRIYLCVHFATDVVAAVFVGIIGGIIGTLISYKLPRRYFQSNFPFEISFLRKKKKARRRVDDYDFEE